MSCGFVFALRFPGAIGDPLLVCAAASAVLGEVVSTLALKGMLEHLGELAPAPSAPIAPSQSADPVAPDTGDRDSGEHAQAHAAGREADEEPST